MLIANFERIICLGGGTSKYRLRRGSRLEKFAAASIVSLNRCFRHPFALESIVRGQDFPKAPDGG